MRTEDLDDLVEAVENVVGWEWVADERVARVYVTEKIPEDDLDDDSLIANVLADLNVDTDVVPVGGEIRPEVVDPRFDPSGLVPHGGEKTRHRPVEDGVSEINRKSTAATAGYFEAEVVDPDRATWGDVGTGDVVRLSNNHVYARSNKADIGEEIIQPSPYDGGVYPDDVVGWLVGYVPIDDGVRVDIAARSIDPEQDSPAKHDLPDRMGTSVRRSDYDSLRGATVTKTGRTTGVTTGNVVGTSATVNVRYPDGPVKIRDCLITTGMSKGGDSGSDVFVKDTGEYVGALFAGSPTSTIVCKAVNIEDDFGVRLVPRGGAGGDDDGKSIAEWVFDAISRLIDWLF